VALPATVLQVVPEARDVCKACHIHAWRKVLFLKHLLELKNRQKFQCPLTISQPLAISKDWLWN
jgi:hypothetical protein